MLPFYQCEIVRGNVVKIYVFTYLFLLYFQHKLSQNLFLRREWLMFEVGDRLLKTSHREVLSFFGDVYYQSR
ncbi:hypothetical protein SAMD00079811_79670 (plasmid) [Scytonema sp. HK-05]|nr:hypothetical protein SAMD00079811_79670 [Scytonema sp. HK-05]